VKKLADINWLLIGSTNEYADLKSWIARICYDVAGAGCIDEICINDICDGLRMKGYEVVPADELKNVLQWQTGEPEETGDYIARVLWSDGSGGVHVRHFIKGVGWDVYYGNVIEWMPLPK